MIAAVAPSRAVRVRGPPSQAERSTGGPTTISTRLRVNSRGTPVPGGSTYWLPQFATGMTGAPDTSAMRAMPFLAFIGQPSGSAV